MIHQKSEICVKFVAQFWWKTENSHEKYVVKLDLFPKGRGDIVLEVSSPVQGTMLRNAEAAVRDGHRSPGITFAEKSCTRRSTPARRSASNLGSCERWKTEESNLQQTKPSKYLVGCWNVGLDSTIQQTKPMRSSTTLCVYVFFYFLLVFLMCLERFHTHSLRIFKMLLCFIGWTVCCLRSTCSSGPTGWTPQKFKAVPKVPGRSNTTHPRVKSWPSNQQKRLSKNSNLTGGRLATKRRHITLKPIHMKKHVDFLPPKKKEVGYLFLPCLGHQWPHPLAVQLLVQMDSMHPTIPWHVGWR